MRIETPVEPKVETARSFAPSPLKSPIATDVGNEPAAVAYPVAAPNPPLPLFRRITTWLPANATARSVLPSPLRSAVATAFGERPAANDGAGHAAIVERTSARAHASV